MATIELPPHMGELRFGPDNNLATNASTEWSAWETLDSSGRPNELVIKYDLNETIAVDTMLYSTIEFQVKDIVNYTPANTEDFVGLLFLGGGGRRNGYNSITNYEWFYKNKKSSSITEDGLYRFEGQVKAIYEGNVAVLLLKPYFMKATIRYRRFRIVKV